MKETEEIALINRYGITTEQRTVYHYRSFTYENLSDALNYAKIDQERRAAQGEPGV